MAKDLHILFILQDCEKSTIYMIVHNNNMYIVHTYKVL